MLRQHEKYSIAALHVTGTASKQIIAALQITPRILGQLRITKHLCKLVTIERIRLVPAEIIHIHCVNVTVQHDRVPLSPVAALEQRHNVAAVHRVLLQILCDNQLWMCLEIRNVAQICFNRICNISFTGCRIHAGNGYQLFGQRFDLIKQIH